MMHLWLGLAAAGAQTGAPPQDLTRPPEYSLIWSDEFSRDGLPDAAKWSYDTDYNKRGWHNQEKQYYSARRRENARVSGGKLIVEARSDDRKLRSFPDWGGQSYSSARLVSRGKASWTYGYFEVRAKLPCGVGTWPAIWTLADKPQPKWPDDGEIDIMEHVGFDPGVVHQTVHTAAYNHVLGTHKSGQVKLADVCKAYHNYQLLWTPTQIRMGVDGRNVFTFDKGSGDETQWPFDGPQYLILNIAVGGIWGGERGIDPKALPARMEIDHVRVYQPVANKASPFSAPSRSAAPFPSWQDPAIGPLRRQPRPCWRRARPE